MFGKLKGKPTLQEIEANFNRKSIHLGNLTYEAHVIQKNINKTVNEMESLAKQGREASSKIQEEMKAAIAKGTPKEKNETH